MGLFDLFIRRKKRTDRRKRLKGQSISVRQQIAGIKSQVESITGILQEHRKNIDENSTLIKEHTQKLKNLEDVLTNQPIFLPPRQTSPNQRPDWLVKPVQSSGTNICKLDIDRFSNQEKLILSAFFNHQDMALSYRDIGSMLGKSANTIKNQMHQILIKADLFERLVDNDMRNRFKLKEGIKVEKYLNINRPSDQQVDTGRLA
jgi:hypothetical protein